MTALILALLAGALVGLALGALGGGGSVLAVPALVYLLGFTPAAATTASLLIVTATSLTALAGLGALTGLLGVGGGFLAAPALVTVLAFDMQAAVGTSLLVISVNSLASLATRAASTVTLDWAVVGPFAAAAILGAWDGKRLAAKVSGRGLQRLFALVLLTVAAFMLIDALTRLARPT
ncbi:TSUP family transporter [Streptomyces noursei]|uniref:TSUP family transporter n=1 Tax=Streptomyces noursei TaxID=1971 RepID=UPI00380AA599